MKRFAILIAIMVLVGGCSFNVTIPTGVWMTAPLHQQGDVLTLEGPDLSGETGEVYTYFARKEWVALEWHGYIDGKNTWTIPQELKDAKSDWATNPNWSADFLASFPGDFFTWVRHGAFIGTSAS